MTALEQKEFSQADISAERKREAHGLKPLTRNDVAPILDLLQSEGADLDNIKVRLKTMTQTLYRKGYIIDNIIDALPADLESRFLEALVGLNLKK